MPVNLESLRSDPEFQRLSPQEQQQLLQAASGTQQKRPRMPHKADSCQGSSIPRPSRLILNFRPSVLQNRHN